MCFSATASFFSGSVLSIAGIAAMQKATTPRHLPFAVIPFIFAIQQFSEGFVWLSLTNASYKGWLEVSANIFLIFAHVIWPILIPLSVLLIEKNIRRKNILYLLLGVGIMLGSFHIFGIIYYSFSAEVDGGHIIYEYNYPSLLVKLSGIFYGVATVLPLFVSTVKKMWVFGFAVAVSYLVTSIFYQEYITSVWCYFAAILSVIIYWILDSIKKISINTLSLKVPQQ